MNDDDDDKRFHMMPAGDIGILAIAAAFLVGFLYLMFGPSPFQPIIDKAKHDAAQPVEVPVTLPEKPKK
jgi:hypothetical protein